MSNIEEIRATQVEAHKHDLAIASSTAFRLRKELEEAERERDRLQAIVNRDYVWSQINELRTKITELEDQSARISTDNPTGQKR